MATDEQALSAIDPATGDFWKTDQSEYWLVAALAHRAAFALTDEQRARNEAEACRCEARAAELAS